MVRETYGYTNCKKTFSRKYNAERHNSLKHNEMAIVFNKETGWISNKKKVNKSPSSSSSKTRTDTNTNNTIPSPNPYHNNLKDFDLSIPYSKNK